MERALNNMLVGMLIFGVVLLWLDHMADRITEGSNIYYQVIVSGCSATVTAWLMWRGRFK